jgi:hypothetical protein
MEPGVRQLHLGLDAGDLRDPEAGRLARAVVQERRLAHAGLAADDQHRALTAATFASIRSSNSRSPARPRNAGTRGVAMRQH